MLRQIVSQLLWHSTLIHSGGIIRIVTRHLYHTNLILHLHHDDRLLLSIMTAQMFHDAAEGTPVGLQHILAQRRCFLNWFSFWGMGTGEALHVTLEPLWCIATHGVFPCTKP